MHAVEPYASVAKPPMYPIFDVCHVQASFVDDELHHDTVWQFVHRS